MAPDDRQGRTAQARQVANELLDALEGGDANAERVLMGAQRLARLLRDSDAQQWLLYEMSGYPERLDTTTLGTAARYLSTSPRFFENGTMLQASLPQLEAQAKAEEQALGKLATPLGLIGFRGHLTRGVYGVRHGRRKEAAAAA